MAKEPDLDIEHYERLKRAEIELITHAYERGANYSNLIFLGGYAGAFTIWGFTRAHLPEKATIWIALLLSISIAGFIFFEVYKMTVMTRHQIKQRSALNTDGSPKAKLEALDEARADFMNAESV